MYFLALTGILSLLMHSSALLLRPCGAPCKSVINTHTSRRIEVLAEPVHFTSPNFPNSQNQSVTYYYSIQSRSDSDTFRGLRLRSATFNVGKSLASYPYCEESDSLVVWDAHYLGILPYYALGIFCGNQTLDIITYSPNAVLMYRTTNRYASPGFNITITRACGLRHFECPSKRTVCIAYHHICDGINDCPEGEDEICTTQCGVPPIPSSEVSAPVRIVGGTESDPHTWPWQAHLAIWYTGRDKGSGSTCGGSLIGPEWVITAAHCCADMGDRAADVWCLLDKTAFPPFHIVEASDIDVTLGIHNVNEKNKDNTYQVKAVIVHPRYNPLESFQCDYCFLQLDRTVPFNDKIQPICLPRYPDPIPGATCYATGFGKTRQRDSQEQVRDPLPSVPLQVDLNIMGAVNCSRSVGTGGSNMLSLTPDMACANSSNKETAKDTCSGDSGGPLSCRVPNSIPLQWQLYGSTSWGYGCASGTPGVYARLRTALAFLADILYAAKRVGWFSNTTVPVINWETALQRSPEEYELTIKKMKEVYVLSGKRLAFTISTYLLAILIHVI